MKNNKILSAKIVLNDDAKEMLDKMFSRAKKTPSDLLKNAISIWVGDNLDLLTPSERKTYHKKQVIFNE
jgi:hypothetical protein